MKTKNDLRYARTNLEKIINSRYIEREKNENAINIFLFLFFLIGIGLIIFGGIKTNWAMITSGFILNFILYILVRNK